MSRPFSPRSSSSTPFVRVNGKIRAREVRVIGPEGKQMGVMQLNDALNLARVSGVDLVEIAPTAVPPVCRVVDYGKYRYEQAKKDKESKKHQHATIVKEVQLSPRIDPHDLSVKVTHAINFLCEDMKVKVALKFRGREMAHTEFGFQVIKKFLEAIAPFGHQDFDPKLIGRGINVMISPLPRNKRAKNPNAEAAEHGQQDEDEPDEDEDEDEDEQPQKQTPVAIRGREPQAESDGFANNPFSGLDVKQ